MKCKLSLAGFDWNFGTTLGARFVNDRNINFGGIKSIFEARLDNQYLNDKGYKNSQGNRSTYSAGEIKMDLTGPYAFGGIGLQFWDSNNL